MNVIKFMTSLILITLILPGTAVQAAKKTCAKAQADLLKDDTVKNSIGSAYAYEYKRGDQRSGVTLVSIADPTVTASLSMNEVSAMQFIPNTEVLAINGTRPGDGQIRKVYLLNLAGKTFVVDLPGSQYWGTSLDQVIARKDIPYIIMIQDSKNPIADIPLPEDHKYYVKDGHQTTFLSNQSAYLFDPKTLTRVGELRFGKLVPVSGAVQAKGTLAAFLVLDPIAANKRNVSLVLVDLKDPFKVLSVYAFGDREADAKVEESVTMQWTAGGKTLVVTDLYSKKSLTYKLSANQLSLPSDRKK